MKPFRARSHGLVEELQGSHRFTVAVLVSVLVVSLITSGYLLLVSQPRLGEYVEMARLARDAHEGTVDEETTLRGWLATGDRRFLDAYGPGRRQADEATRALLVSVRDHPDVTGDVVATLLARQEWQAWADRALASTFAADRRDALREFLLEGKTLFDRYRTADARATGLIRLRREQAIDQQTAALEGVLAAYLLLLAAAAVATVRRRRRLHRTISTPIDDLHETVLRLRDGDLTARAQATLVPELEEIGTALASLAAGLDRAGHEARTRETRLASLAERFETVVSVGREIASSLSERYVSTTVTAAAADLLGARTTLWLRRDDHELTATHRSEDPHGSVAPRHLVPSSLVTQAVTEAMPCSGAGVTAYPLVLAGRVNAVLETDTDEVDDDTGQVLAALLSTAAAALESAHLHQVTRELADLDGLTHLPNRRRFEIDVDVEWERCRRYDRPLSLVLMDLDHFKSLNDEHGHLLGDQVLREVASVVAGALRGTDTAYRYGGEEIVVLLRETSLEDAGCVAERLRDAVSSLTILGDASTPPIKVTTSAGVAARTPTMELHTELVALADVALYDAKRLGRDRVVSSGVVEAAMPALEARASRA